MPQDFNQVLKTLPTDVSEEMSMLFKEYQSHTLNVDKLSDSLVDVMKLLSNSIYNVS